MKRYLLLLITVLALSVSGQNNPPVAVNDTVRPVIGFPFEVKMLSNDYDPDGDSIYTNSHNNFRINDSTWRFHTNMFLPNGIQYDSVKKILYTIYDNNGGISFAYIIVILRGSPRYDYLDINNIKALISSYGNHFYNEDTSRFEVPIGSGKHPILNHTLWIGGINTGQIYIAGEFYRHYGADFYSGPISSIYDTTYPLRWNRVWKLNKTQIDEHRSNWSNAGYTPIEAIANWPAHGYVHFGQTANIAPFKDTDQDGVYNPMAGDYPLIRGDQTVFFVLNDIKSIHSESQGIPLGVELHAMAYAYDQPDDSALNNTIFFHYDIINRSVNVYTDTYIGLFSNTRLGSGTDDYLGCDVSQGMYYVYNGDPVDGNGEYYAYGEHPPAFGLKVIGGPYLPPDGIDNSSGQCDEGINGLNFGDMIPDNERLGLGTFTMGWYYENDFTVYPFYNIMRAYSGNETQYMFGDSLTSSQGWLSTVIHSSGGEGPACRYFFPGDSDTLCNYGTYGLPPLGGYNQNGFYWTDSTCGNTPGYRKGVGSVGPFTFHPGETVPVDYCFIWARDYHGDHNSSVDLLRERIAGLTPSFKSLIQLHPAPYGLPEHSAPNTISLFPNPVKTTAQVILDGKQPFHYYLYHVNGIRVSEGVLKPGDNVLDLSHLPPGIYLLTCDGITVKVVKM